MLLNIGRLAIAMMLGLIVSSTPGCSPGERDPGATTDGTNVSDDDGHGHSHNGDDDDHDAHDKDEHEGKDHDGPGK